MLKTIRGSFSVPDLSMQAKKYPPKSGATVLLRGLSEAVFKKGKWKQKALGIWDFSGKSDLYVINFPLWKPSLNKTGLQIFGGKKLKMWLKFYRKRWTWGSLATITSSRSYSSMAREQSPGENHQGAGERTNREHHVRKPTEKTRWENQKGTQGER